MTVPGANPKDKVISYLWYTTWFLTWRREELYSAVRVLTSVSYLTMIQKHEPKRFYKVLTSSVVVSF